MSSHIHEVKNTPVTDEASLPFAFIQARDSKGPVWAVIAAPPSRQAAIKSHLHSARENHEKVSLPDLVKAFHANITLKGRGNIPDNVRGALDQLYSDVEQHELDV